LNARANANPIVSVNRLDIRRLLYGELECALYAAGDIRIEDNTADWPEVSMSGAPERLNVATLPLPSEEIVAPSWSNRSSI